MQLLSAVALEGADIIGVAELGPQLVEDRPIAVARGASVALLEMLAQILLDAVVVDQRVVDIEEEDQIIHLLLISM